MFAFLFNPSGRQLRTSYQSQTRHQITDRGLSHCYALIYSRLKTTQLPITLSYTRQRRSCMISVTRVVHRGWFSSGISSTRVIQGATAAVCDCPKESTQHGLYRVLWVIQRANIFLGNGNRSRGFRRRNYSEAVCRVVKGMFYGRFCSLGGL